MIMNRLTAAIRQHSWFAVIVEIVTIVIGIFIGLQVDAWNSERLRQRDVEFQLTRIEEDARLIYEALGRETDVVYAQLEKLNVTLGVLDGAPLGSNNRDDFLSGLQASFQQRTVNLDIPGLQLLYDSGDIDLISDESVRETLLAFLVARRTWDEIMAHQRRLWDMNLEVVFRGFTFNFAGFDEEARSARTEIDFDVDRLRSDVEFRGALGRVAQMENYTLTSLRRAQERIGQLISVLENRNQGAD